MRVVRHWCGNRDLRSMTARPVNFCKPAGRSAVHFGDRHLAGRHASAVILTGNGLGRQCAVARISWPPAGSVIAQDEATSVVWGMPRRRRQCRHLLRHPSAQTRSHRNSSALFGGDRT